ncbi:MAG: hypothetical protein ACREXR_14015 [Gammaproteobacteria bacterium]
MSVRTLTVTLLLVALIAGCAELSGEGDIKSSTYTSFQQASEMGVFESGWLPRALPRSATNIVEVHNVDSSEIWARFRYSGNDILGLTKGCAADRKTQLPNAERTKRDAEWWPAELTEGSAKQSRNKWMIFSCPKMRHAESIFPANLAVDFASNTAWYWITK